MLNVEISSFGLVQIPFQTGMTALDLITSIKAKKKVRFQGNYTLTDTSQHGMGAVLQESDVITEDGRTFYLTAWLVSDTVKHL